MSTNNSETVKLTKAQRELYRKGWLDGHQAAIKEIIKVLEQKKT